MEEVRRLKRGWIITIEGIDGAGKATLAQGLKFRLEARGSRVTFLSFPDYDSPIGGSIRSFLQGSVSLNAQVRQLLYAANRYERREEILRRLEAGDVILCDRYTPSGLAYGLAQGLDLEWMSAVEQDLPAADCCILVDVSVQTSIQRSGMTDRYEKDAPFLEACRAAYHRLASGDERWIVVQGERSPENVVEEAWVRLSKRLTSVVAL